MLCAIIIFMNEFVIKDVVSNIEQELEKVGFDKSYLFKAVDKYIYKNIKIFGLNIPQANILKQTAISVGADCAVHRETITSKVEKTDCLLGGSVSQLKKISQKLRKQPFKLPKLAEIIDENLTFKLQPVTLKNKVFDFSKPYIVGVLNLTKDSFSDGGAFYNLDSAKEQLSKLINDGADIVELGAESTRPYSSAISAEEQLSKLIPILEHIKEAQIDIPISIDTRSAVVAQACIKLGADIINDVSGMEHDNDMVIVIAKYDVPIIIQHSQGTPENMQDGANYVHLIDEIFLSLNNKINEATNAGIKKEKIIVDPGIGFGKTIEQNYEIIEKIAEFRALGCPIMLGISRKSLLEVPDGNNELKDILTLAINSVAAKNHVNFIRVHNIKLHKQLFNLKFF